MNSSLPDDEFNINPTLFRILKLTHLLRTLLVTGFHGSRIVTFWQGEDFH